MAVPVGAFAHLSGHDLRDNITPAAYDYDDRVPVWCRVAVLLSVMTWLSQPEAHLLRRGVLG